MPISWLAKMPKVFRLCSYRNDSINLFYEHRKCTLALSKLKRHCGECDTWKYVTNLSFCHLITFFTFNSLVEFTWELLFTPIHNKWKGLVNIMCICWNFYDVQICFMETNNILVDIGVSISHCPYFHIFPHKRWQHASRSYKWCKLNCSAAQMIGFIWLTNCLTANWHHAL